MFMSSYLKFIVYKYLYGTKIVVVSYKKPLIDHNSMFMHLYIHFVYC